MASPDLLDTPTAEKRLRKIWPDWVEAVTSRNYQTPNTVTLRRLSPHSFLLHVRYFMTRQNLVPSASDPVAVLHVVYQFTPEPLGGTEVYVQSLVQEATSLGLRCAIAAPGGCNEHYQVAGVSVYRVAANLTTAQLYGEENSDATARWVEILQQTAPRILHIHARTPMLNSQVLRHARRLGIKVIYTVHTPTAFCQRGTMLEFGVKPCNGLVTLNRCAQCALHGLGVPKLATQILTRLPTSVSRATSRIAPAKIAFVLSFRARVKRAQQEQSAFFAACDHIVAVCGWIEAALKLNGIAAARLSMNRQGLRSDMVQTCAPRARLELAPLKVFALGRCDRHKGFDLLIAAIKRCVLPVELDLCMSISSDQDRALAEHLKTIAIGAKVRFHVNLSGEPLLSLFQNSDLVAVPSVWMETGPLVVLEAFSQQLPVIGSRRGGIAELVQHGKNGWLAPAGDVGAWTRALDAIAQDRPALERARANIGTVRTMKQVAIEHLSLYEQVLARDNLLASPPLPK